MPPVANWRQRGDSAWSLYNQHLKAEGYTAKEVNDLVENQLGDNYIGEDGGLKSNVEIDNVVTVKDTEQLSEVSQWNENVTSEIKTEISANEATIDKNNKDVDSLNNVKKTIDHDAQLREESGVYEAAPGDPGTGLAIGRGIQLVRDTKKKAAIDKKTAKLNKTSDSLKEVNTSKKKEIERRDSLYRDN